MLQKLKFNLAYYQKPVWDTGISPPELLSFIATHSPGRALDLGCGTGTNGITLAKSGWDVTGVDFAYRAIQMAEKRARQNGVKINLLLDDVTRMDSITGDFNLILDMGCYHSLPSKTHSHYTANIDRFLASDGTYLLYVFFKNKITDMGPGVTEEDILALSNIFLLVQRQESIERGIRKSAWLTFQKHRKFINT